MQITIDTSKLSRDALQAIDQADDMEAFLIDLIEKQISNSTANISNEEDSVVAILRRIESKVDAIDSSSKRRPANTNAIVDKKDNADKALLDQSDKIDNEKAAEELAKALDFFS